MKKKTPSVWTPYEQGVLNHWEEGAMGPERRHEAVEILTKVKKDGKSKLDWSGLSLASLPPILGTMKLRELDISQNLLQELASQIGDIQGLVKLNAANNMLQRIDDDLGRLKDLQELNLSHNRLRFLPNTFERLKIKDLQLDDNFFSDMPPPIAGMSFLQSLSISNNLLSWETSWEAPDFLNGLHNLKHLDMSKNKITLLPVHWHLLWEHLESLNLSDNALMDLSFVSDPKKLTRLNLSNNNTLFDLPTVLGPLFYAKKGSFDLLRATSRPRNNMVIQIDGTHLIAGLSAVGRLELRPENDLYDLPEDLRPPPGGASMGHPDFSDIDPDEFGAGPFEPAQAEFDHMSAFADPTVTARGRKAPTPPAEFRRNLESKMRHVERWVADPTNPPVREDLPQEILPTR